MDRRHLLKLMAAAAAASAGNAMLPLSAQGTKRRVVVAGAGIIGASTAYHLAKLGAHVTVMDGLSPASHASRGTLAWINATWAKQPRAYHALNQKGVAGWGALTQDLGIPILQNGSLEWFASAQRNAKLVDQIAEQVAWGEPARMLTTEELRNLEPNLTVEDGTSAAFSPNDAHVDPVKATHILLKAVQKMGGEILYPCTLLGIRTQAGRLASVETSQGDIRADRLILATGAAPDIVEHITGTPLPQRTTPGVIVVTKPMPRIIHAIVAGPDAHLHQRADGRIALGEQAGAPDTAAHAMRLKDRPNQFPQRSIAEMHAHRIIGDAAAFLPKVAEAEVEDVFIGWRPLPLDGHPVIGAAPEQRDVYVTVTHSGVTLSPILGSLAAHEIMTGEQVADLAPYRLDRAFTRVKRY